MRFYGTFKEKDWDFKEKVFKNENFQEKIDILKFFLNIEVLKKNWDFKEFCFNIKIFKKIRILKFLNIEIFEKNWGFEVF